MEGYAEMLVTEQQMGATENARAENDRQSRQQYWGLEND